MNIENRVKRHYEKNLDAIAKETISVKIKDYPDMEADAAWEKISQRDIAMWYAYSLDEKDIYYKFFNECVEAGKAYQSEMDAKATGKNALITYASVAQIPCCFVLCAAGFLAGAYFGTEISMDNYSLLGGAGVGIAAGVVGGHYTGKFFGRRKYKKGFLKETRKSKERALSGLMKTPGAERLIEVLKGV